MYSVGFGYRSEFVVIVGVFQLEFSTQEAEPSLIPAPTFV